MSGSASLSLALSPHELRNEIQRPVAIVVHVGLLTSVSLNMIFVPALYFRWGRGSADAG